MPHTRVPSSAPAILSPAGLVRVGAASADVLSRIGSRGVKSFALLPPFQGALRVGKVLLDGNIKELCSRSVVTCGFVMCGSG